MKRLLVILAALAAAVAEAGGFRVAPAPKEMSASRKLRVPLDGPVEVRCAADAPRAGAWIADKFEAWFGARPKVSVSSAPARSALTNDEAYAVRADAKGVLIEARTLQGVRYAGFTIRQLAIPKRGTKTTEGFILPELSVVDAPSIPRRFLHLCWMPEFGKREMERRIRLAAALKFNYVILESWGVFRSPSNPWCGWPDGELTVAEAKRLTAVAKDLGVTIIPQFNVFGHATMSRGVSGKHAVLDLDPKHAPLFEPAGGWNWCLTNPETVKVQEQLIREEWEAFGRPPFVHIGCDEAHDPSCPDCLARPYAEIVGDHIVRMSAYVKSLGARPMVWQDMFLDREDARWKGYQQNGDKASAAILDRLPKDVVICDWFYSTPEKDCTFPTLAHFVSKGFDTITCPCYVKDGCVAQGRMAREKNLFGYMGTTWCYCFGGLYADVFTFNAFAAWGSEIGDYDFPGKIAFMQLLRQVGQDAGISDRLSTGVFHEQSPSLHRCNFGWRGSAYRNWADPKEK